MVIIVLTSRLLRVFASRTTATGGRIGAFSAVDCVAATSCAALAGTTQFAATSRSESAFWNGARWKVALTA